MQAFWKNNISATDLPTNVACLGSRGWFTRADSTPLAIISFRLAGMSDRSFPPRGVAHHLETCYNDDIRQRRTLEYFDFPFDFSSDSAIKAFKKDMSALARHLTV